MRKFIIILITLLLSTVVFAQENYNSIYIHSKNAIKVLEIGESSTLEYETNPVTSSGGVIWTTNSDIISISENNVKALSQGIATVTAEAFNGKTATYIIVVNGENVFPVGENQQFKTISDAILHASESKYNNVVITLYDKEYNENIVLPDKNIALIGANDIKPIIKGNITLGKSVMSPFEYTLANLEIQTISSNETIIKMANDVNNTLKVHSCDFIIKHDIISVIDMTSTADNLLIAENNTFITEQFGICNYIISFGDKAPFRSNLSIIKNNYIKGIWQYGIYGISSADISGNTFELATNYAKTSKIYKRGETPLALHIYGLGENTNPYLKIDTNIFKNCEYAIMFYNLDVCGVGNIIFGGNIFDNNTTAISYKRNSTFEIKENNGENIFIGDKSMNKKDGIASYVCDYRQNPDGTYSLYDDKYGKVYIFSEYNGYKDGFYYFTGNISENTSDGLKYAVGENFPITTIDDIGRPYYKDKQGIYYYDRLGYKNGAKYYVEDFTKINSQSLYVEKGTISNVRRYILDGMLNLTPVDSNGNKYSVGKYGAQFIDSKGTVYIIIASKDLEISKLLNIDSLSLNGVMDYIKEGESLCVKLKNASLNGEAYIMKKDGSLVKAMDKNGDLYTIITPNESEGYENFRAIYDIEGKIYTLIDIKAYGDKFDIMNTNINKNGYLENFVSIPNDCVIAISDDEYPNDKQNAIYYKTGKSEFKRALDSQGLGYVYVYDSNDNTYKVGYFGNTTNPDVYIPVEVEGEKITVKLIDTFIINGSNQQLINIRRKNINKLFEKVPAYDEKTERMVSEFILIE